MPRYMRSASSTLTCSPFHTASMAGSSTVPSPDSVGLFAHPSRAPSKLRWSAMYATSKPALRCHERTSSGSQFQRPSCEYFVCAWKSMARMFGPAVSSAAMGRGTSSATA